MRLLLIDNYDSFTFNLFQQLAEICGEEPLVIKNDECDWDHIKDLDVEGILLSPGPGRPDKASDFRVCREVLEKTRLPILGVCLGHQGIGWFHGGRVELSPEPVHGRTSRVRHEGHFLFDGVNKEFQAVRYHSLCVNKELPSSLEAIAWTEDGLIMGLAHKSLPHFGIQFHPESVLTVDGPKILENFVTYCRDICRSDQPHIPLKSKPTAASPKTRKWSLRYEVFDLENTAEELFSHFFLQSPYSFWLDSSLIRPGDSRFSYMGDARAPFPLSGECFQALRELFSRNSLEAAKELPFDFQGGLVGYLGYEVKKQNNGELPNSNWIFADRFFAIDHQEQKLYTLKLSKNKNHSPWLEEIKSSLKKVQRLSEPHPLSDKATLSARHSKSEVLEQIRQCQEWIRIGESYELCLTNQFRISSEAPPWETYRRLRSLNSAPFAAYLNFADYQILSASPERFLKVKPDKSAEAKPIKGTCSRGSTPTEDALAKLNLKESIKDQSENLMIVDLLRNDLGMVSEIGSVKVPKLMEIESYATVHQMVSTITSKIKDELTCVDAIEACFPGGSMTGAPKKRSVDLLEKLEAGPRGIYSGALGYISLTGASDLSIVIRSLVHKEGEYSLGAGGAIVALSEPEAEVEEMLLKAKASLRALIPAEKIEFN